MRFPPRCWVPTPTSPAHTLCQSSLNEPVRESLSNEIRFMSKSQAIFMKDVSIVLCMFYKPEKKIRKVEE